MYRWVAVVAILASASACSTSELGLHRGDGPLGGDVVVFELIDGAGDRVGIAQMTQIPGGVFLEAEFTGLPPGTHGFHIHETGLCAAPFNGAGGHFNPTGVGHGRDNQAGTHAGDLDNIFVPDSQLLTVSQVAEGASLAPGGPDSLADVDGSALIVHADLDDYESDPSGNTGTRIACGVIVASETEDAAPYPDREQETMKPSN